MYIQHSDNHLSLSFEAFKISISFHLDLLIQHGKRLFVCGDLSVGVMVFESFIGQGLSSYIWK